MKPLLVAAGALSAMLVLAATPALAADPGKDNPLAVPPQVDSTRTTPPPPPGAAQRAPAVPANAAAAAPPAAASSKPVSPNEAAGLPDLDAINRTPAKNGSASSKVEFPQQREPSFHEKDRSGTEITEYRDHAKPTEINVHSNFGTNYQMSPPPDDSPNIPNSGNGPNTGRVPSIHITY
ncbi:hypothetical protein [Pararobbsia alpina]|uniref:Uncharacterized protein n=1 Tax=Pararobbsia alpina TaxID=621374 RepID=A0A6S7B4A2_9BURK|nr:hypothetical protein LMG28138_02262 [Pararobbsia alpina]